MENENLLKSSLDYLLEITQHTHNSAIEDEASSIWVKNLSKDNPLWSIIKAKPFYSNSDGLAHVMAMVDPRLPNIGLIGFFGSTSKGKGIEIIKNACSWLKDTYGVSNIYGPIHGTITRDYRFNLSEDFIIPGEPVNPVWFIDCFVESGFNIFNQYVSGLNRRYRIFNKLHVNMPIYADSSGYEVCQFKASNEIEEFSKYHELMNKIFPQNSIYCPTISYEERLYNMKSDAPLFNSEYCYFLNDRKGPVGFIVAFPHNNNLIIKTLGVLPQYRGKKLAGLLINKVHDQAAKNRLESAIYSTVRVGNSIYKRKRPGISMFRKYITMNTVID